MEDLLSFAKTRKFWVAVVGAAVAYMTLKFGTSDELTLLVSLLSAAGVYVIPNEKGLLK